MKKINKTTQKSNLKIKRARGITLLQLMLALIIAGILGTIVVNIIRYYTV